LNTKKPTITPELTGETIYGFPAPEFLQYPRGPVWYLVFGVISLAFVAFGILAHAITLTLAYLLFVGIYFLTHHHESGLIEVRICERGIVVKDEFTAFSEISEFGIIWDPPYVCDLKLQVKRRLRPVLTVHIFGQDPERLRELLEPKIKFNPETTESPVDLLIRLLRL